MFVNNRFLFIFFFLFFVSFLDGKKTIQEIGDLIEFVFRDVQTSAREQDGKDPVKNLQRFQAYFSFLKDYEKLLSRTPWWAPLYKNEEGALTEVDNTYKLEDLSKDQDQLYLLFQFDFLFFKDKKLKKEEKNLYFNLADTERVFVLENKAFVEIKNVKEFFKSQVKVKDCLDKIVQVIDNVNAHEQCISNSRHQNSADYLFESLINNNDCEKCILIKFFQESLFNQDDFGNQDNKSLAQELTKSIESSTQFWRTESFKDHEKARSALLPIIVVGGGIFSSGGYYFNVLRKRKKGSRSSRVNLQPDTKPLEN